MYDHVDAQSQIGLHLRTQHHLEQLINNRNHYRAVTVFNTDISNKLLPLIGGQASWVARQQALQLRRRDAIAGCIRRQENVKFPDDWPQIFSRLRKPYPEV